MLVFSLFLFDAQKELLALVSIEERQFVDKGNERFSREVTETICMNMMSAELEIWYHDDDVSPVCIRTMYGRRNDIDEQDEYMNDILFQSDDEWNEFAFDPKLLTYFSFRIDTHRIGTRILLQIDHDSMLAGKYGQLSFNEIDDDIDEVSADDIISLIKLESDIGSQEDLLKFWVPRAFILQFKYIIKAKRWARKTIFKKRCTKILKQILEKYQITELGVFELICQYCY